MRRPGESILIGKDIEVSILKIYKGECKLGINAPKGINIIRDELLVRMSMEEIDKFKNGNKG
jgi:carbon storage regulator